MPSALYDLREEGRLALAELLAEAKQAWAVISAAEAWSPDIADQAAIAFSAIHRLVGTGGALGYASLYRAAAPPESALRGIKGGSQLPSPEVMRQIDLWMADLDVAWNSGLVEDVEMAPDVTATASEGLANHLLYLFGALRNGLADLLAPFGYTIEIFDNEAELEAALATRPPGALIRDIGDGGAAAIPHSAPGVPLILVSDRGDMETRLAAARAGCRSFLLRPVDGDDLAALIEDAADAEMPQPYRVLIVDDDPVLARAYALSLRLAGMNVEVVTEPMAALGKLSEFHPELILMDVYMPGCSGIELAQVVRQFPEYLSVPIVFLSVESDVERQIAARIQGGDDFLAKPIKPVQLTAHVASRVRRARQLRSVMDTDSLTGALNHVRIKDRLRVEIDRARRDGHDLVFALIDLDFFKRVNDQFGHLAGDRVIKSLSTMLSRRLRSTDIIGRYGGEEFAVILPCVDSAHAAQLLDRVRDAFGSLRQGIDGQEFHVTLSCGVSGWDRESDGDTLIHAADMALYTAKATGRNRVVTAEDGVPV